MIKIALLEYKTQFGAFPSGDSRAIVRALTGDNPKRMPFIGMPPDGELLDPWGTPYRIYSGDAPLIRSAGPDKLFDTGSGREKTDDYFRD